MNYDEWRPWFAWYPVRITWWEIGDPREPWRPWKWPIWLRWIERREVVVVVSEEQSPAGTTETYREYRLPAPRSEKI